LRLQIYEYALVPTSLQLEQQGRIPALLLVNKLIHHEAYPIFYEKNIFRRRPKLDLVCPNFIDNVKKLCLVYDHQTTCVETRDFAEEMRAHTELDVLQVNLSDLNRSTGGFGRVLLDLGMMKGEDGGWTHVPKVVEIADALEDEKGAFEKVFGWKWGCRLRFKEVKD
jgi:hypothetical protein